MSVELDRLVDLLSAGGVVVLSGAGISTESGIPDYRGPNGALRSRLPMTIREFVASAEARQRYWARSQVGWRRMTHAQPNTGHRVVAALEQAGIVSEVITQNVDRLHQRAGSREVIDLHGSLDRVLCLDCGAMSSRARLYERFVAVNGEPHLDTPEPSVNPDGDVELARAVEQSFRLVGCECCGSDMLKPDVVFFGENVPKPRVERCFAAVDAARALLVLGSSLTVMSGLRFVRHAHAQGIPVAIVNAGVTRGDPQASLKLDAPLGDTLQAIHDRLLGPARSRAA